MLLKQSSNNHIYKECDFTDVKTENKKILSTTIRDMLLSMITLKYTQSNSVVYSFHGQMIGIGAGQQSRDCTILARKKAEIWFLRHHPKVYEFALNKLPKDLKHTKK